MHYSVISAKYLDSYRLELVFKDGKSGVVDFQKYIREGGVFARLADLNFFKQFSINPDFGVVCWGNEVDVAPETLYIRGHRHPVRRHGRRVPGQVRQAAEMMTVPVVVIFFFAQKYFIQSVTLTGMKG